MPAKKIAFYLMLLRRCFSELQPFEFAASTTDAVIDAIANAIIAFAAVVCFHFAVNGRRSGVTAAYNYVYCFVKWGRAVT